MSMLNRILRTTSISMALILTPALVSAPTVLSSSPDAHKPLQKAYRDLARTLHVLRRQEKNLGMKRQFALADDRYLTIDLRSSTFRMNWGTALLKEGVFSAHAIDKAPGGAIHISLKEPPTALHLSNGVSLCTNITERIPNTPCIYLPQQDLLTILDFVDTGTTVIWQF